jgi:hypothetical protein
MSDIVIYGDDYAVIGLTKREIKRLAAMEVDEGIHVRQAGYNWEALIYVLSNEKKAKRAAPGAEG